MDWPFTGRAELVGAVRGALQEAPGSAILEGDVGVGKTRLALVVADELRAAGWHVEVCFASHAGSSIPFGALSHLLPLVPAGDVLLMYESTRRHVVGRASGRPLLLFVDDAPLLDNNSVSLLHHLASSSGIALLLTRRTGETAHDETIMGLWKDRHAARIEVPALSRVSHDELVTRVLGADRAGDALEPLWRVTLGNPLFLREILSAALSHESDEWTSAHTVDDVVAAASRSLGDLIRTKTGALAPPAHAALELVALAEPISTALVETLVPRSALAELERPGIISREVIGGAEHVRTAHPVYGATIRASMPPRQRQERLATLGRAMIDRSARSPGDAIRAATWLIEAGEAPPAEVAGAAAAEALAQGDPALAERLARLAIEHAPTVDARVVYGTALSVQHRLPEARDELQCALDAAFDEGERARAAIGLARHLAWMERDVQSGSELLERVSGSLGEAHLQSELRVERAIYAAILGDARSTVSIAEQVVREPGAAPQTILSALIQSTLARCMLGEERGLIQDLDEAERLAAEAGTVGNVALEQVRITRLMWLRFVDIDGARALAASEYERSLREGGLTGIWAFCLAWVSLPAGDLATASAAADRSVRDMERFDPFHNFAMALSLTALVRAMRGDVAGARKWFDRIDLQMLEPRSRSHADRAAAWIELPSRERAAHLAIAGGERSESATMVTWAAPLYHDAVRFGAPELAVEPLQRLARDTRLPIVVAMADHAAAAAARDVDALVGASRSFRATGNALLAAEALGQAAGICDDSDPRRPQLEFRAARLAAGSPGAATPLVAGVASPISEREEQVAELAAGGATSPEIGARLFLATRTVENHLASVYRKLGISGREELTRLLSTD